MIRYIAYLRKSTDEKNRQLLSLISQRRELRDLVSRERLAVVQFLEESRSAKAPGRGIFNQMIQMIERGEANGILCWDIDRLYRNPIDEGRVRWLLERGTIKSIRTPNHEYGPDDAGLLMAIEGGRASDFIIRLRRNVARGVEDKLLSGAWPGGQKPFGYVYDPNLKNIAPDPVTASVVEQSYHIFAAGRHGLEAISEGLARNGYLTARGRPWGKARVHRLLSNELYVGIMKWGGRVYEGSYQPIVSPELFKRVAQVLKVRSKPRKSRVKHDFALRGIFRCSCGSMLSAQFGKGHGGIYRYYRCTRKAGKCDEAYIQEHALLLRCSELLTPIALSQDDAHLVCQLIDETAQQDDTIANRLLDANARALSEVQQQLDQLAQGYAKRVLDDTSYTNAARDAMLRKKNLKVERRLLQEKAGSVWIEPAKEVITTLSLAAEQISKPEPHGTSHLVRKIGTNHLFTRKSVSWDLVAPYDYVAALLAGRATAAMPSRLQQPASPITSSTWGSLVDYLRTYFTSHHADDVQR